MGASLTPLVAVGRLSHLTSLPVSQCRRRRSYQGVSRASRSYNGIDPRVLYGAPRRGRSVPGPVASRRRYADPPADALLTGLVAAIGPASRSRERRSAEAARPREAPAVASIL